MATQNITGRGVVVTSEVFLYDDFIPTPGGTGEATFSLSFACYAQNNNRVQGYVKWYDPLNGVKVSATLPETSVKTFTNGLYTTCKAMKAAAATEKFSVATAGIYSENGNADGNNGTQTGGVAIIVAQPGVTIPGYLDLAIAPVYCGVDKTAVLIAVSTQQIFLYVAGGCLDRGKIVFGGGGQNQQ